MPIAVKKLLQTLCPAYVNYEASEGVRDELLRAPVHRNYGRLSALYDTLVQQMANQVAKSDDPDALCHTIFNVLMHKLLELQKRFDADNANLKLKGREFHEAKFRVLQDIFNLSVDELKNESECLDQAASERSLDERAEAKTKTGVCIFINGTDVHHFLDYESLPQTAAREMPAFSLAFNGPNTIGRGSSSSAESMSVGDSARAVGVVTKWFREHDPSYMQHLDVSGYSRGAVAASRALGLERERLAQSESKDEPSITYSSMQIDPVAATMRPDAAGAGSTKDLETAYHLPEQTRLLQLRMANENGAGFAAFGGECMRCGEEKSSYSPFMPARSRETLEAKSGVDVVALPGMHTSSMMYCRAQKKHKEKETQTLHLSMGYFREHFSRMGFLLPERDYEFQTPRYLPQSEKVDDAPERVLCCGGENADKARLAEFMSMNANVAENGDYRRGEVQGMARQFLYWVSVGKRCERDMVGRYGVGQYRFLNVQHFELFKKTYPELASLLNPELPLSMPVIDERALNVEIKRLQNEFNTSSDPNVKLEVTRMLKVVHQMNLYGVKVDFSKQGCRAPIKKCDKHLEQIKSVLTQALQQYIHEHWADRNKSRLMSRHTGVGIERALAFDRSLVAVSDKKSLNAWLKKMKGGGGNYHDESMKGYVAKALSRLEESGFIRTKGRQAVNSGQYSGPIVRSRKDAKAIARFAQTNRYAPRN